MTFRVFPHKVEYGDHRKFWEYKLAMYRDGVLAGVEESPRRLSASLGAMWSGAKARITLLKSHRLFAVPITKDCIKRSEGHSCNLCAVAEALRENQERMGLSKLDSNFRVESYGAFMDCRGIVLERHGEPDKATDAVLIANSYQHGVYGESLEIWTMQFDEWFDFQIMERREWREKYGMQPGDRACRPVPASFVLDLDAMRVRDLSI
jgi:hypothetical protein